MTRSGFSVRDCNQAAVFLAAFGGFDGEGFLKEAFTRREFGIRGRADGNTEAAKVMFVVLGVVTHCDDHGCMLRDFDRLFEVQHSLLPVRRVCIRSRL